MAKAVVLRKGKSGSYRIMWEGDWLGHSVSHGYANIGNLNRMRRSPGHERIQVWNVPMELAAKLHMEESHFRSFGTLEEARIWLQQHEGQPLTEAP